MGELVPAVEIDKRTFGDGKKGPITERLQKLHQQLAEQTGELLLF